MASTTTGNSKRLSLAIATAVAGIVLASGMSAGSLLGWLKPLEAGAASGPVADLVRPSLDSGEASRASRGEREQRPAVVRATPGERDDD